MRAAMLMALLSVTLVSAGASVAGERSNVLVLTLENAINRALTANRDLRDSGYNLEERALGLASANSVFDWKAFPNATAGVSGDETQSTETYGAGLSFEKRFSTGSIVALRPSAAQFEDMYTIAMGVAFEQPLLRGLGRQWNLNRVHGAEYSLRSSGRSNYNVKVSTTLATVNAFYEVAKQEEFVGLDQDLVDKLRGHVQAGEAKEKVGYATPIDVFRARIQLKNAEDSLAESLEAYQNSQDNLKSILALAQEASIAVDASFTFERVTIAQQDAVAVAMNNRVELDQTKDDLAEAVRNAKLARHNVLPDLNIVFDYTRSGETESLREGVDLDENVWSVRLVSRTDLARTSERLAYSQSLFNVESVKLRLETVKDDISKQVAAQLRSLVKASELYDNREEQITQARGKLELALIKFNYRMANNFDLIEAEMELNRARTNRLIAAINYIAGTYRLRQALGTLIEREPEE